MTSIKRLLICSGLSVLLVGSLILPAQSGSESVEFPDSSNVSGDTFSPNNIIGLIQRLTNQISGATAQVSDNGRLITITVPEGQVDAVLDRMRGSVRLQIRKYSVNDIETLETFENGATLADVLQQAIATLQQTDPARAARVQRLLDQLNRLLAAVDTSANVPYNPSLLVAAYLEAISGELQATEVTLKVAQANEAEIVPVVVYEPSLAGEVVSAVEEHNKTVQSLNDQDVQALASNTSFIVIADLLEQIAGELRGQPVPEEELKPIPDIIASLSS